jgi:hypothetical protein
LKAKHRKSAVEHWVGPEGDRAFFLINLPMAKLRLILATPLSRKFIQGIIADPVFNLGYLLIHLMEVESCHLRRFAGSELFFL